MFGILFTIFMFVLLVVCGLMTVIILMQKPSANAGMGAALGGGAAESVFGGETANVLLKYTVRVSVVFFVLSFLLYMAAIAQHRAAPSADASLPKLVSDTPTSTVPGAGVTSAKTTTAPGTATAAAPKAPAASVPAASAPAPAPKN